MVWRLRTRTTITSREQTRLDNVTIYDTVNGRRTERKRANMKVAPESVATLRVDFRSHFTVTFDGKKAIDWDDITFRSRKLV